MKIKLTDLSDEKVLEELVREFSAGGLVPVQVVELVPKVCVEYGTGSMKKNVD